jgi:hypothetical protein
MLLHLSRCENVMENWYYSHSLNSNRNTSNTGYCIDNFIIILYKYIAQQGYSRLRKCYFSHLDMTIPFRIETTVVYIISMWILVSVDNAMRVLVLYFINTLSCIDTNNLVNVTPPVQIQICCWKPILKSSI